MSETPKQSDQLPEEAPPEQVPDDVPAAGEGAARESAEQAADDAKERDTTDLGHRGGDEAAAYEREAGR